MLAVRGLTLALVLGSMAACDTSSSSVVQTTGPDCPAQLRYHGATYTAFQRYRFAHEQPTKLGAATPVCVGTTIPAGDPITGLVRSRRATRRSDREAGLSQALRRLRRRLCQAF